MKISIIVMFILNSIHIQQKINQKKKSKKKSKLQKPHLGSVGVYGTKKLNEVILKELLGKDFEIWIQKGLANDPNSIELEKKLVDKIQQKFNFPLAEFSVVQFFEPENISVHIILYIEF